MRPIFRKLLTSLFQVCSHLRHLIIIYLRFCRNTFFTKLTRIGQNGKKGHYRKYPISSAPPESLNLKASGGALLIGYLR